MQDEDEKSRASVNNNSYAAPIKPNVAKFAMYLATWAAQDVWKPVTTTRTMPDN